MPKPYLPNAMTIKTKMKNVLADTTLPEEVKSQRYDELLQEYQLMTSKSKKQTNQSFLTSPNVVMQKMESALPLAATNVSAITNTTSFNQ